MLVKIETNLTPLTREQQELELQWIKEDIEKLKLERETYSSHAAKNHVDTRIKELMYICYQIEEDLRCTIKE